MVATKGRTVWTQEPREANKLTHWKTWNISALWSTSYTPNEENGSSRVEALPLPLSPFGVYLVPIVKGPCRQKSAIYKYKCL